MSRLPSSFGKLYFLERTCTYPQDRADIFELSEDGAKETTILLFTPIQEERDAFVNGGGKDYTQGPLQRVSIDDLVLFAPQSTYGSRPESRNSGSRW